MLALPQLELILSRLLVWQIGKRFRQWRQHHWRWTWVLRPLSEVLELGPLPAYRQT